MLSSLWSVVQCTFSFPAALTSLALLQANLYKIKSRPQYTIFYRYRPHAVLESAFQDEGEEFRVGEGPAGVGVPAAQLGEGDPGVVHSAVSHHL